MDVVSEKKQRASPGEHSKPSWIATSWKSKLDRVCVADGASIWPAFKVSSLHVPSRERSQVKRNDGVSLRADARAS
jgi:hypothetical protein